MTSSARPPRALVIGGSLGGLFAANLLLRQGWDVEVFEQSGEALAGRGAGIITHPQLFETLARIGIATDESFGVEIPGRITFDRSGATIATLPQPQNLTTWGRLYLLLKAAFPAEHYHFGFSFQRLTQDANGVTAYFSGGGEARGDLLIGADGIRSAVRAQLAPGAKPLYAGYVGWRGLADEKTLPPAAHRDLFPNFAFCLPPHEQMLGYPVAGFGNSTRPGERCYNFVWYRPVEEMRGLPQLCTDTAGKCHDMAIPPPLIRAEVLLEVRRAADDLLCPQFAEVVRQTRQPFFQAIFDVESSQIAFDHVALLGDAAFVARPHCGMGVTKAAGDAITLAASMRDADNDIPAALARYQEKRARFGSAIVKHARALGAYLQGSRTAEAAGHHTPGAVMREIAVNQDFV
jgi:2-polyprenyl-6-methoxyphenol hydroxylase-like FAD-dependent oxidoreductase